MNNETYRPAAPEGKVNTSDDFELCFLRHQYLRRAKYNPSKEEMQPYIRIVENISKNTYFVYINLFKTVGMADDDIVSVGMVHLVSFLGLYHLDRLPEKKRELTIKYLIDKDREPTEADYLQKNKANFTMFLKQRMEDLVRVCRQKLRNIKGTNVEEYLVFCGAQKPPKYHMRLLKDHELYGYKKIEFSVFRNVRKKANVDCDATMFSLDGLWYVAFPIEQKGLEIEDLIGSLANPFENEHNKAPDELLIGKEAKDFSKIFKKRSDSGKRMTLRNFIEKNKYKRYYREEIAVAKKLLRRLGG